MSFSGTTRVLVSSMAMTSIGRSGPSTRRSAAPLARLNTAASEFDGMVERSHCTT